MNAASLFIRFHPLEHSKSEHFSLVFAHLRNLFVFLLFFSSILPAINNAKKTVNLRDLRNFTIFFYDRLSGEIEHEGMCYAKGVSAPKCIPERHTNNGRDRFETRNVNISTI